MLVKDVFLISSRKKEKKKLCENQMLMIYSNNITPAHYFTKKQVWLAIKVVVNYIQLPICNLEIQTKIFLHKLVRLEYL